MSDYIKREDVLQTIQGRLMVDQTPISFELVEKDPEFQAVHSQFEECFTRHPLYDCVAIFDDAEDEDEEYEDEEAFYGVYCSFNQYAKCFIVGVFHSLNDYEGETVVRLTTKDAHEAAHWFAKIMYCLHRKEYDVLPHIV